MRRSTPTVETACARIRARPELSAFTYTRLDDALHEALAPAEGALSGLPYSLKDFWDTRGIPSTGCSDRHRSRVPDVSSPVHAAFESAGAILLGKTNASDLGLAIESQSYVGGVTKNPHNLKRSAGGSSGGAAAAVAAGMSAFDWGSDFGGSIRLPAAWCGVYGMRLSSEAWPIRGHFPAPPGVLAYMNGQGPLTPNLKTMRRVLDAAAPTLRIHSGDSVNRFKGAYLYVPRGRECGRWPSFPDDIQQIFRAAGVELRTDHELPSMTRARNYAFAMYSSHLDDLLGEDEFGLYDGFRAVLSSLILRGRFGDRRFHPKTAEVLLLIALGRYSVFRDSVAARGRAQSYQGKLRAVWDRGFALALPTSTRPAPRHGFSSLDSHHVTFTMPGNISDATGLAIPFGRFADGLPRSLSLWGPPGSEKALIELAETIEQGSRDK